MQQFFLILGVLFGAAGTVIFLSSKSKYKWPKEKGKKREWMTNGQYLNSRIRYFFSKFKGIRLMKGG